MAAQLVSIKDLTEMIRKSEPLEENKNSALN